MSIDKAFGIGCFNFGIKKKLPFNFKGDNYLKELENCLTKISNLNNLNIESDDDFKDWTLTIDEDLPYLSKSGDFFPSPYILDIQFELYIPFRIQAEITDTKEKYLGTNSENFRVSIHYNYHFPVTIVEVINPSKETDPSTAVQIIREFLKKEINTKNEKYIKFESLGPSPFHIDCFIKPNDSDKDPDNWLIESEETTQKGYDSIIFNYNTSVFKDADEALDYLRDSIIEEFSFVYKYISIRVEKMYQWSEIQTLVERLVTIQKTNGIIGIWQKIYTRSSLIGNVYTELAEFESKSISVAGLRQKEYNEIYRVKDELFFQNFIDNELNEHINYPSKQMAELVSFFESRRVKNIELIIAIFASLIGGAIGAMLTIYYQ